MSNFDWHKGKIFGRKKRKTNGDGVPTVAYTPPQKPPEPLDLESSPRWRRISNPLWLGALVLVILLAIALSASAGGMFRFL